MRLINRVSKLFQPTIVVPKDSTPSKDVISKSYQLMINAGIINNTSTGMFTFLPLGLRSLQKLTNLVEDEIKLIDGQKILLPILTSSSLWKKTSRLEEALPELFMLKDRHGKEYILSPTFEESVTKMISQLGPLLQNQLPLRLYQIASKWRDEMKPRLGLFRSREFIMKDLYAFDVDEKTSMESYEIVTQAYHRILKRIGVPYIRVKAENGMMGGSLSHEYHYVSSIGEDRVAVCRQCGHSDDNAVDSEIQCPKCHIHMDRLQSVEVGHTFLLGTRYSKPLNATYISSNNKKELLTMSCYGLGLTRLLASAIEIASTESAIVWPVEIAPYSVCIIPPKQGSKEESASQLAYDLYFELEKLGIDAIIDDRVHMTIGRRHVDARKTGYPYVIIAGKSSTGPSPTLELHDMYNSTDHQVQLEFPNVVKRLKSLKMSSGIS